MRTGDSERRPSVASLLRDADAAIHTASRGDESSANLDAAVADAAIEVFTGSGTPYIHISGIYGDNTSISQESPLKPPTLVARKDPIEHRILDATGMWRVVIVSSVAYSDGGGALSGVLLGSPRDGAGNLIMIGSGQQH